MATRRGGVHISTMMMIGPIVMLSGPRLIVCADSMRCPMMQTDWHARRHNSAQWCAATGARINQHVASGRAGRRTVLVFPDADQHREVERVRPARRGLCAQIHTPPLLMNARGL